MAGPRSATLRVTIRDGAGPPYEQLRDAIRVRITHGTLAPGDRLPPVRVTASDLGLAPNTVARAFRALEQEGWLVGRGRAGTFVADPLPAPEDPREGLTAAARVYGRRAQELGFDIDAAVETLRALR